MKVFATCAIALVLISGAYVRFVPDSYDSPYGRPVVEGPTKDDAGTFDGLLTMARSLPPSSKVNVLWMHGMCTHPSTWVDERIGRLSAALGGAARTIGVRPIGHDGASLRTERITVKSATIDVKFLSWSPLTAASKDAMA